MPRLRAPAPWLPCLTNPCLDCSFQRGLKRKSLTLIKKLRKAARARRVARA